MEKQGRNKENQDKNELAIETCKNFKTTENKKKMIY